MLCYDSVVLGEGVGAPGSWTGPCVVLGCGRGASWIMGRGNGVSSNSAQPPRRPISTTRSNIRVSSSFLDARVQFGRFRTYARSNRKYLSFSSDQRVSKSCEAASSLSFKTCSFS